MAGVFSPANTTAQDDAVAIAIAGTIRLTLEKLTYEQVVAVLRQIGYCPDCGANLRSLRGKIRRCFCRDD